MGTDRTNVVVTGLGAITPLGADVASTWDSLLAGRSGVTKLTEDWAQELPARIAAWAAIPTALAGCLLATHFLELLLVYYHSGNPGPT